MSLTSICVHANATHVSKCDYVISDVLCFSQKANINDYTCGQTSVFTRARQWLEIREYFILSNINVSLKSIEIFKFHIDTSSLYMIFLNNCPFPNQVLVFFILITDFSWWSPGDYFPLLYHHGNTDSYTNQPRRHYTAHVQFACGVGDLASHQIKITVE